MRDELSDAPRLFQTTVKFKVMLSGNNGEGTRQGTIYKRLHLYYLDFV